MEQDSIDAIDLRIRSWSSELVPEPFEKPNNQRENPEIAWLDSTNKKFLETQEIKQNHRLESIRMLHSSYRKLLGNDNFNLNHYLAKMDEKQIFKSATSLGNYNELINIRLSCMQIQISAKGN